MRPCAHAPLDEHTQDRFCSGGVNADCIAAEAAKSGGGEAWKCFMAQYTLPHIKTPHYIVNSFYDAWQWGAVLGMPWKTCGQPPSHSSPARPGCERKLPPACPAPAREALDGAPVVVRVVGVTAAAARSPSSEEACALSPAASSPPSTLQSASASSKSPPSLSTPLACMLARGGGDGDNGSIRHRWASTTRGERSWPMT